MRQLAVVLVALAPTLALADERRGTEALDAFLKTYWDPSKKQFFTYSDRKVHPEHAHGPEGGLYSDFWWVAHLWETVMDAYERTGDPRYRALIGEVYDGFDAAHPDWANDWNDDLGWWAHAAARAHELTGEQRYIDKAAVLFEAIWAFEDATYGGGIWWKRDGSHPQKGLPIDAPFVMTALRLHRATGEARYLEIARREHAWLERRFVKDGKVDDHIEDAGDGTVIEWQFTYDYGTWIGASLDLYRATGERRYLEKATAAADHAVAAIAPGGIFQGEGDGDGAGFKMILTRHLARLAEEPGLERFRDVLARNARAAWANRRADDLTGPDWSKPAPTGAIQSFAAASAADAQLHALPRKKVETYSARPTGKTQERILAPVAEARRSGVDLEDGHTAGWNRDGTRIELDVDVPAAGKHAIVLRFSAGAGDASRTVLVGGKPVANVKFLGTPGWDDRRAVVVPRVELAAGKNTIAIALDAGRGDGNYVNLERIAVTVDPSNPAPLARGLCGAFDR